jgi:Pentapeptide repeats (8 copies)
MSEESKYDWAKAMLALLSSHSNNLGELAQAAELDPKAGDLADVDLSDLDLSGQDFGGWDLRNAKFSNARLAGAEFRNALIDPCELIEAIDWKEAKLDDSVRLAANQVAILSRKVHDLELSIRTDNCLKNDNIIGGLMSSADSAGNDATASRPSVAESNRSFSSMAALQVFGNSLARCTISDANVRTATPDAIGLGSIGAPKKRSRPQDLRTGPD